MDNGGTAGHREVSTAGLEAAAQIHTHKKWHFQRRTRSRSFSNEGREPLTVYKSWTNLVCYSGHSIKSQQERLTALITSFKSFSSDANFVIFYPFFFFFVDDLVFLPQQWTHLYALGVDLLAFLVPANSWFGITCCLADKGNHAA